METHSKIPGVKIYNCPLYTDDRGWLVKPVPNEFVSGSPGTQSFGEIYLVNASEGIVRGSHYHQLTTEYFSVVSGEGRLRLKHKSIEEEYRLSMAQPRTVRVPPHVKHAIIGASKETMILLAYADKAYDPKDNDTYPWDGN